MGLPRKKRNTSLIRVAKDKHCVYRIKKQLSGCCPRCGKPSYPYYLCMEHRHYKRIWSILQTLVKDKVVVKEGYLYKYENRYSLR